MKLKENILLNYLNNKVLEVCISNIRSYYYIGNQTLIAASNIIALFNEKIKKPAELKTKYKYDYSSRILKLFDKTGKKCVVNDIRKRKIFDEQYYNIIAGSRNSLISDTEMNLLLKLFDDKNGIKENVFITDLGLIFDVNSVKVLKLNQFLRDIDTLNRIDECAIEF